MTKTTLSVGLLAAMLVAPLAAAPEAAAQDKPGTTAAPFLLIGTDARGTAMGSAQTAVAQGPAALHWNPAGLAAAGDRSRGGAVFSTQEWFLDETRHSFVGAALNVGTLGTVGVSVTSLDYGEERVTTVDNPEGTGEFYGANDLAVGLSYARLLTEQFSIGATAKLVHQQLYNESATTGAVDLGVRYATDFQGIVIGASMTNFGGDLQLSGRDLRRRIDNDPDRTGDNDELPGALEIGEWPLPLAFRVGISAMPVQAGDVSLMITAEGQAPSDNSQSASFGGEAAWRDLLFVRGGYRQAFSSSGLRRRLVGRLRPQLRPHLPTRPPFRLRIPGVRTFRHPPDVLSRRFVLTALATGLWRRQRRPSASGQARLAVSRPTSASLSPHPLIMRIATRLGLAALAFVVLAGTSSAQDKNVTFQVDMQPYIDLCQHDTETDAVEIRGNIFGWDDTAPDLNYDGDGTYSYTAQIAEGTAVTYKFFSTGGLDYEDQTGDRMYTVTADADQTVPEVTFADGTPEDLCGVTTTDENYEVTFTVDMSVQLARGAFDPATQTPAVAGGSRTGATARRRSSPTPSRTTCTPGWWSPARSPRPCAETTLAVPGTQAYKFVLINTDGSISYETGGDRTFALTGDEPDADNDGARRSHGPAALLQRHHRRSGAPGRDDGDLPRRPRLGPVLPRRQRLDRGHRRRGGHVHRRALPQRPRAVGVHARRVAPEEASSTGPPGARVASARSTTPRSRTLTATTSGSFMLTYPAGALRTLVGKLGINGSDNESASGADSFYPIETGTSVDGDGNPVIDIVFGAVRKQDGSLDDSRGPTATGDPIYDPYILIDNTATPPTAMAVDGTGEIDVANEQGPGLARGVTLSASRPNPASGLARFVLGLDRAMDVQVQVVDLMGRTVATLAQGQMAAGDNEIGFDASRMAAGVYVLRVQAGGEVVSRRMTVVR